jgi:hypothetical protein
MFLSRSGVVYYFSQQLDMFYDEHRFLYVSNVILHLCDGWLHDFLSNFVADGYSGRFRRQFFNLREQYHAFGYISKAAPVRRHGISPERKYMFIGVTPCLCSNRASRSFALKRCDVLNVHIEGLPMHRSGQYVYHVSFSGFRSVFTRDWIYGRAIDLYRMTIETAYKQLWTRQPYQFTVTCRKSHDIYFVCHQDNHRSQCFAVTPVYITNQHFTRCIELYTTI